MHVACQPAFFLIYLAVIHTLPSCRSGIVKLIDSHTFGTEGSQTGVTHYPGIGVAQVHRTQTFLDKCLVSINGGIFTQCERMKSKCRANPAGQNRTSGCCGKIAN